MTTVLDNPDALKAAVGDHLGFSDWLVMDQERIDLFADATGDRQWIHTDPERASRGPFGTTIAHGYLTLSLVNYFLPQIIEVRGISMGVNVGVNRVRFPAPVPVGSRIRAGAEVLSAEDAGEGVQAVIRVTVEVEGSDRPACVADTVSRYFP